MFSLCFGGYRVYRSAWGFAALIRIGDVFMINVLCLEKGTGVHCYQMFTNDKTEIFVILTNLSLNPTSCYNAGDVSCFALLVAYSDGTMFRQAQTQQSCCGAHSMARLSNDTNEYFNRPTQNGLSKVELRVLSN